MLHGFEIDDILQVSSLSSLSKTIQLALTPVFLLAGIGTFINMMVGRLARIVDRARSIEAEFTPSDHPAHKRQVAELRLIDRRISLVNNAIFLCVASAIAVCILTAGLFLARLMDLGYARTMAIIFIVAMVLLTLGLVLFLVEVRVAVAAIRVRDELLERRR